MLSPASAQQFHRPKSNTLTELKYPRRQNGDFGNSDLWTNRYYNNTGSLTSHSNGFNTLGTGKSNYSLRADNSVYGSCYNSYTSNKHPYYPSLNNTAATQSQNMMSHWQQSLQNHHSNTPLPPKLSPANPLCSATNDDLRSAPISNTNRFQDMFLRSSNPANYFISCINETSQNWCQPATQKDSYFNPPPAKNICPLCGKSYARPSTLKTHMRIHSGERPFHCKVCNKSFSQAANLTAHLRVHSGEKPFSCTICHKTFSQSSSVTTHMRTHSGDRPYKCPICRKGFSDSSTLTKHLRIHSGEKPYRCNFCSMSFSQSGNLNRHMKVHEHRRKDSSPVPTSKSPNH